MRWMTLAALAALLCAAPARAQDRDSDGDGLSDFRELHKYGTDPGKRDSDGDGKPDGDWDERREYAYSIRTVVRVMPPYAKAHLTDDYQDARIRAETDEYLEIEVVHYPLNTVAKGIAARTDWLEATRTMPATYRAAGVTTNWNASMRKRVLAELKAKGIDARQMTDKAYVEAVSRWLVKRAKGINMFCTYYIAFENGKPRVLPGCADHFDREIRSRGWTPEQQFAHELFGRSMFEHRTRGTCTSSAVYLTTAMRAALVPTRMIVAIPPIDASDPAQVAMLEQGITHHEVRRTICAGVNPGSTSFTAHTLNEVWVGGRWHRLNYDVLGDNILSARYMGLMTRVHTFGDLSEADFAQTWGTRYARGARSRAFPFSNPYRTLEVSDRFGRHAKVPNPEPPGGRRTCAPPVHALLTMARAYWEGSPDTPPQLAATRLDRFGSAAVFFVHAKEVFRGVGYKQYGGFRDRVDPRVVLRAAGHPDVEARATGMYFTSADLSEREFQFGLTRQELAKLKPGVPYSLHPANGTPSHRWRVAPGVTLTRPR